MQNQRQKVVPRDLQQAVRTLRRAPAFAVLIVVALTLGIGAGVALLSLVAGGLSRTFDPFGTAGREVAGEAAGPEHPVHGWYWSEELQTIAQIQGEGLDALLWILGGAAVLVLGIACSNVLILLLARSTARRREMAVRAVVGAPRRRLLRQLLAEGALLSAAGGGLGIVLGVGGVLLLRSSWPAAMERWIGWVPDPALAALALGIPVLVTLLVGLAPVLAARERELHGALTAGARVTAGPREGWLRSLLAISALAVSLALLTSAGLLLRGFLTVQSAGEEETTLAPRNILTLQLDLPEERYGEVGERAAFYEGLLRQLGEMPGVEAESIASRGAWVGLGPTDLVLAHSGFWRRPVVFQPARHHVVSPGFFDTLGVQVVAGRAFSVEDRSDTDGVVVVNQSFAHRFFPGADPLGRPLQLGGLRGPEFTVIGVVRDLRPRGIGTGSEPEPALYLSLLQHPPRSAGLALRTNDDTMAFVPAVEAAVQALDAEQLVYGAATMDEQLARFASPLRWFGLVFGALAALAVLLTAQGVFSVISYNVARRTREIGIRMALGAAARRVERMILRQSLRQVAWGTLLGLWLALPLARLLQLLFLGVRPLDLVVYGSVLLLLTGVALFASYLPARSAARVDPVIAMQAE